MSQPHADPFLGAIIEASSTVQEEFILFNEPNLEFQAMCGVLVRVAKQIARINELRLSKVQPQGKERIPKLEGQSLKKFSSMITFGLAVAKRMSLCEECQRSSDTVWDVFLSHPGEEKSLYVAWLHEQLVRKDEKLKIFLDTKDLKPGTTVHPDKTMLLAALTARVLVFTCSHDFVQKEWTVAEFLCGLMRIQQAHGADIPPFVLVDCMPGSWWLGKHISDPQKWLSDVKALFGQLDEHLNQKEMMSMLPCETYKGGEHIQKVIVKINEALKPVNKPKFRSFPDGANYTPSTSDDRKVQLWSAMSTMPNAIDDAMMWRVLTEQAEGTFSIRKSMRPVTLVSRNGRKADIYCVRVFVKGRNDSECIYYDSFRNKFVWIKSQDGKEVCEPFSLPHLLFLSMHAYSFHPELDEGLTYSSQLCQLMYDICREVAIAREATATDDADTITSATDDPHPLLETTSVSMDESGNSTSLAPTTQSSTRSSLIGRFTHPH